MRKTIFSVAAIFSSHDVTCAQTCLKEVFTENMVIQPTARVRICAYFNNSTVTENRSWSAQNAFKAHVKENDRWQTTTITPASDIKVHTVRANNQTLHNVVLGEIRLYDGQPNMLRCANDETDKIERKFEQTLIIK